MATKVLWPAHNGRAYRVLHPAGLYVGDRTIPMGDMVADAWLNYEGPKMQVFRLVMDQGTMEDFPDFTMEVPDEPEVDELDELDSDQGDAGDAGDAALPEGYDPGEYTVAQVLDYAIEHPELVQLIYDLEMAGKARSTLTSPLVDLGAQGT